MVLLSVFIGLRSFSTGTDTMSYVDSIRTYEFDSLNSQHSEFGFVLISCIIFKVFHSEALVLLFFSTVTVFFFLLRFWELRKNFSLTLLLFGFLSNYYLMSTNIVRQVLAMSLVFWSTRFLFDKDKEKPIVFIIICISTAFLFHTTAIVGLGILIINYLVSLKELSLKKITILIAGAVAVAAFINNTIKNTSRFDSLNNYISADKQVSGQSSYYSLIAFGMILFMSLILTERSKEVQVSYNSTKYTYISIIISFLMGSFLSTYYSSYYAVSRISFYFTMLVLMYYAYKWDSNNITQIKKFFWIIYCTKIMYDTFNHGYYGIMPYKFFWNN